MAYEGKKLQKCEHSDQTKISNPHPEKCLQCVELGDNWIHLRTCFYCGDVFCCGSSKNKHTQKHFEKVGYPVFHITESGAKIAYCYLDDNYFKFK